MKNLYDYIVEKKTGNWFPVINDEVMKLFKKASKEKTIKGKSIPDFVNSELEYDDIPKVKDSYLEKAIKGFEDLNFMYYYANGNYGNQDDIYALEDKLYANGDPYSNSDSADYEKFISNTDAGDLSMMRFVSSDKSKVFLVFDNGDWGEGLYFLSI